MNPLIILLSVTGFLIVILFVLLIVALIRPVRGKNHKVKEDLKKIKQKISEEEE